MSGVVDSSGAHTDSVHSIDVLLGFNLANRQARIMSGHCGAAELPNMFSMWSGTLMLKQPIVEVYAWNDMMLQDLVSISDVCHMHKRHPTTMMDSCPDNGIITTKTVDLSMQFGA